ncbi:acyltransferase family protein [Sangeribacter muris]|jgi:fucose 4-O-acetylase-like acetyltransferase|uniref:acyltransferase family protein n=1 Tax=Sangeribacter muris TaxID=2880703 RepID=UPI001A1A2396|nr:acyltransferase family protein [Sangeribacter muris]MBJ2193422.1 acyltransferase family protein [Muribaculaceae bacterium]
MAVRAKEKNRQIVLLTLFAMTLVVAGHSDITPDFKNLWIFKWAYSFHMPLFFFISGFLIALTVPNEKLKKLSNFPKEKSYKIAYSFSLH